MINLCKFLQAENFKLFIFCSLVFVIFFTGCDSLNQKKSPANLEKLSLGVGSGLFMSPVWVAEQKGFFGEEGLDLTIKEFATGKDSFQDMLKGATDISTLAPTPIMFNSFLRQDFAIFATISTSDENVKLIARRDSGINIPEDLKGKRIGVTARTSSQFVLSSFLFYNGIDISEIVEVKMKPPDLPDALKNNQVDAIVIWEPFASIAQQLLQDNALYFPSSNVYKETFNFAVMKDFAEARLDVLEKFLRAIDRAEKYIRANVPESQAIVADKLKMDKDQINTVWDNYNFELSLGQTLLLTLEDEARWAINTGLTDKKEIPDYLDYLFLNALENIKPGAVTVIR